jgi:hypothetical protein
MSRLLGVLLWEDSLEAHGSAVGVHPSISSGTCAVVSIAFAAALHVLSRGSWRCCTVVSTHYGWHPANHHAVLHHAALFCMFLCCAGAVVQI